MLIRFVKRHAVAVTVATAAVMFATTGTALGFLGVGSSGTITKVNTLSESTATTSRSTSFVDVPGMSTTIVVPSGETAIINARFFAESQCTGGRAGNWCSVRILANGTEMFPQSGIDAAFDSVSTPEDFWESHAVERDITVGPGTYIVHVQRVVTSSDTAFRLDDMHMTVERSQRTAS